MSSDPEVSLDKEGNLCSLHKKGSEDLLTPDQVASCVNFYTMSVEEVDGLPQAIPKRCPARSGLKVNLIAGATGSGKTSLIHIAAGGMEIEAKLSSDTKCPSVYILRLEGNDKDTFAFLDTAGLCDTAVTADRDIGKQELLINAVAATIQKYQFEVMTFLLCVDLAGRVPGNFGDVWPQMQIALGGEELGKYCYFVVTKANGGSKVDEAKLKQLRNTEFFRDLERSPLHWPVLHAGRQNLALLGKVLKPTNSTDCGFGAASVDSKSTSLAAKKKVADDLQRKIDELESQLQKKFSKEDMIHLMMAMQAEISYAHGRLDSLGWCRFAEKRRIKAHIDETQRVLQKLQDESLTGEEMRREVQAWKKKFDREMEEIRRMHRLGSPFWSLAGGTLKSML